MHLLKYCILQLTLLCYIYDRFVSSLDNIQENHPYLDGLTLSEHAENGTLYTVDLTDVNMGEIKVRKYI